MDPGGKILALGAAGAKDEGPVIEPRNERFTLTQSPPPGPPPVPLQIPPMNRADSGNSGVCVSCGKNHASSWNHEGIAVEVVSCDPLGSTYEITQPPPHKIPTEKRSKSDPGIAGFPGGAPHTGKSGQGDPEEARNFTHAERWKLKKAAAEILDEIPAGVKPFRVAVCHRIRGHGVEQVQLLQERGTNRVFYGGLMKCASVWVCPVCAAKITERRREELTRANASAHEKKLRVSMLTLTAPHKMGDDLKKLLQGIRDARRAMFNRKGWKRIREAAGIVGSICALEVTHGGNGWHVHVHELVYCEAGGAALDAEKLLPLWQSACTASGLGRPNVHGLKVGDGSKAAAYVAKFGAEDRDEDGWGIEHEMTKAHVKRGKKGGRSPWDLLRVYAYTGEERAAELFRVYAVGFRGRRQLVWSRGLRDLLGVRAKSDEELVEEEREEAEVVWSFGLSEWRWIIDRHLEGAVLQAGRERGKAGVYALLYPDG